MRTSILLQDLLNLSRTVYRITQNYTTAFHVFRDGCKANGYSLEENDALFMSMMEQEEIFSCRGDLFGNIHEFLILTETELGELTHGQLKDLLLDNFSWIQDSSHADRLLILLGR